MTSHGSAHGRFQRAIERRNLFQAELAMRELGTLSLLDALCAGEREAPKIVGGVPRA